MNDFKAKCVLRLLNYLYLQCRNWLQLVPERTHRCRCSYKNESHISVFVVELLYTNIAAFSEGKSKCSFQEETGPVGCTYPLPEKKNNDIMYNNCILMLLIEKGQLLTCKTKSLPLKSAIVRGKRVLPQTKRRKSDRS